MNRNWGVFSVCFENALIMFCWTALAIHFEKWWIALFAILFFSEFKRHSSDDAKSGEESEERGDK